MPREALLCSATRVRHLNRNSGRIVAVIDLIAAVAQLHRYRTPCHDTIVSQVGERCAAVKATLQGRPLLQVVQAAVIMHSLSASTPR